MGLVLIPPSDKLSHLYPKIANNLWSIKNLMHKIGNQSCLYPGTDIKKERELGYLKIQKGKAASFSILYTYPMSANVYFRYFMYS